MMYATQLGFALGSLSDVILVTRFNKRVLGMSDVAFVFTGHVMRAMIFRLNMMPARAGAPKPPSLPPATARSQPPALLA